MTRKCRATIARLSLIAEAVLLVTFRAAAAQAGEDDHLEPCQITFPEYENRIEAISRAAMPGKVDLWVSVIPSFQPEWSIGVSSDAGRYFITHVVFQQSLWGRSLVHSGSTALSYDFSKPHVRTTTRTASISAELHEALHTELARSIENTHPNEEDDERNGLVRVRLDGVIFEFKSSGRCGRAWSPDDGTRNSKLVDLILALALLADSNGNASSAREDVVRKLRELRP
jgi:hypothetical protein